MLLLNQFSALSLHFSGDTAASIATDGARRL